MKILLSWAACFLFSSFPTKDIFIHHFSGYVRMFHVKHSEIIFKLVSSYYSRFITRVGTPAPHSVHFSIRLNDTPK